MTNFRSTSAASPEQQVDFLNKLFEPLNYQERLEKLYELFHADEILITSSFGTKSVFLLHLLSRINPGQQIHFIDTGYHFPETLRYKQQLAEDFGLEVIDVHPNPERHAITRDQELWNSDPDRCCHINKVEPLNDIKPDYSVWISGLMGYQTDFRSDQRLFEWDGQVLKCHPLIDIDEGEFLYHVSYHDLPQHPLEAEGFGSVGCTHCTERGKGRSGRWQGQEKTECGLHPDYFANKMQS